MRVDILFETREPTVEAEIKTCPRCRTENKGRFPEGMPGPLQYGYGIVAFATHLLRDLKFVEDAHGHAWARRMAKLLLDTCHKVRAQDDKALDDEAFKAVRKRYRTILDQSKRELPPATVRLDGQRGRIAKSDAENLHEALVKHETDVLRFARDPDTPLTNNRAERDIRMAKVKQKISGCFRTLRHAEAHCRISTYLQSMASQGYNPLASIQIALNGNAAAMIKHENGGE